MPDIKKTTRPKPKRLEPKIGVLLRLRINNLARVFYAMHGYNVAPGFDFSSAVHPMERLMWEQAKISFDYWTK